MLLKSFYYLLYLDIFACFSCVGEIIAAAKDCYADISAGQLFDCVKRVLEKINPEDHCFSCIETVLQVVGMLGR